MDKKVVRESYESCLNVVARLSAYAASKPILITEVNNRQDILASEDLINFCIHARRLIENTNFKDVLYKTEVKTNDKRPPLSLGEIIGYLIHHDMLVVFRCNTRFKMFQTLLNSNKGDDYFQKIKSEMYQAPYSEPIPPLVLFKSDRSNGMRLINLVTFLEIFSEKILLEIIKSNPWLQDDLFKDVDMTEEEARNLLSRIQ